MMTSEGRFEPLDGEQARLMRNAEGHFIVEHGEHVVLKGREFTVDAITEETITLRPVRQMPGKRTLPGPIPSQRISP